MAVIRGRTVAAAVMVGLIGGVSGAAGAVVAGRPAQVVPEVAPQSRTVATTTAAALPPLVLKACANKRTGALTVIGVGTRKKRCVRGEVAVRFAPIAKTPTSILEPDGSLRLSSPDGRFELVVSDKGVGMRGPGGQLSIDGLRLETVDRSDPVGAP